MIFAITIPFVAITSVCGRNLLLEFINPALEGTVISAVSNAAKVISKLVYVFAHWFYRFCAEPIIMHIMGKLLAVLLTTRAA